VLLELLRQKFALIHLSHPLVGIGHSNRPP
jgi:hypothetical protein